MWRAGIRNTLIGVTALDRLRHQMERACERAGFPDYVWWIPLVMNSLAILAGCIAVGQRVGEHPLAPVAALIAVALVPWGFDFAARALPWAVHTVITSAAALTVAIRYPTDYDFSVFVLVMLTGHLGAVARPTAGLLSTTAVAGAVKLAALTLGLEGSAFWIVALIVGWDVGFVMQYQQRRLTAERRAQAEHEAAAILHERQRIAREVHDVIAHSLSVTMLHLTAARRSLEEDRESGVDESIEALRDAERLGRAAMSDIRHTVGLLGDGSGQPTAAPDLRDLDRLVDDFRAAGLDVDLDVRGDPASVPANAGLGLYRIVQESLANIAKHQPAAHATITLELRRRPAAPRGLQQPGRADEADLGRLGPPGNAGARRAPRRHVRGRTAVGSVGGGGGPARCRRPRRPAPVPGASPTGRVRRRRRDDATPRRDGAGAPRRRPGAGPFGAPPDPAPQGRVRDRRRVLRRLRGGGRRRGAPPGRRRDGPADA